MGKTQHTSLISKISYKTGLSDKDIEKVLSSFFDEVMEEVSTGNDLEIRGFGKFTVKKWKGRPISDVNTQAKIEVPDRYIPKFETGIHFKKKVNEVHNGN